MGKLRLFICWLFLAIAPTIPLHAHGFLLKPAPKFPHLTTEARDKKKDPIPSYDEMMQFLDDIESGALEKRCSPEDLERIKDLLVFLARQGVLPDNSESSLSLEDDISELLDGKETLYYEDDSPLFGTSNNQFMIVPALFHGDAEIVLTRNFASNIWRATKKFIKKHQKEIIIGVAIVVGVGVIIGAVSAGAAGAVGAGAVGAASSKSDKKESPNASPLEDASSKAVPSDKVATVQAEIDNEIFGFKEKIIDFFPPKLDREEGISLKENGRVLGSLLAHNNYNTVQDYIPYQKSVDIDKKFGTNYGYLYSNQDGEIDFGSLSHQVRGEKALSSGYYKQAVQEFGKAIELNRTNPDAYLHRGVAHFGLGNYDRCIEDYRQFASKKPNSASVSEFSLGFAKGLPKGVYDSGEGLFLFMGEFVKHPIETSKQVVDSFSILVDLVANDEWGVVGEALAPEIHQIVTEWDSNSSAKNGELAGYALGKHGADILVPGALAKVATKSVKSAKELATICKNLEIAGETLLLETAAEIGSSAKIAEVIRNGKKTVAICEELGLTSSEIGQLKNAGKLESFVAKRHLNPLMEESYLAHKKVESILQPYVKNPMPEAKVRALIHEAGMPTFPRPKGIPDNYLVVITEGSGGMEYVHPTNKYLSVRIMPGKPHSPLPSQQQPYVIQMKNGKAFDKFGNMVPHKSPEAHIPFSEFIYRN